MIGVRWALFALPVLVGCADGLSLSVDVRTDFVPGPEFSAIRVTLVGEDNTNTVGAAGDYLSGQRAIDLEGLEENTARLVNVELLDSSGTVVAERSALLDHRVDRGITLALSRDCAGVMCPGAAAAAATACFGGRCTEPDCIDGTEPSCPEPECTVDTDCPALNACSTRRCIDTLCLYAPTIGACEAGTYCSPERGCVALPSPVDASMDAMPLEDAGPDMSVAPVAAPRLLWPQNGLATGGALAVACRWEPVPDAVSYDVEFRAGCPIDMDVPCVTVPEFEATEPSTSLDVSLGGLGEPVGQRYRWRVRGCRAPGDCSDWSDERYVDMGRRPTGFDGDGTDKLMVGSTGHVTVFEYAAGTFEVAQELATPFSDMTSGFGRSSSVGDFDGDGYMDAAIGAPFDRGFGAVAIYHGTAGGLTLNRRLENPPSSGLNNYFADSLCVADFDADGYADLAVEGVSGTYVYGGGADGIEPTLVVELPGRLRSCGDVNEDGRADIVVGSSYFPGHTTSLVETTAVMFPSRMGYFVGDVNGDGFADFSAGGVNNALFAYGRAGGLEDPVPMMGVAGGIQSFDYQALGLADLNGDGYSDLVMGDAQSDARFPGVVAYSLGGPAGIGPRVGLTVTCQNLCSRRGSAVSYGFDLNGDGFGDAAVGANEEEGVFVFFGNEDGLAATAIRVARTRTSFNDFGSSL